MITSAKSYTKKNPKTDRENPRTNGKRKAIQTTSIHIHTLKKRKREKKILLLPKSTSSIWDDSLSIQVFNRCRHIKLFVEL